VYCCWVGYLAVIFQVEREFHRDTYLSIYNLIAADILAGTVDEEEGFMESRREM